MKVSNSYPPNYKAIAAGFPHEIEGKQAVFTYGDTLYNPSNGHIPEHLMVHEEVHARQQGRSDAGAKAWWERWLRDPAFRMEQELEAYGAQYAYARKAFMGKHVAMLLHELASDLSSSAYGNVLSYGEAASKIRNAAKDLANNQ